MPSNAELLQQVAGGATLEIDDWPGALEFIVARLDTIVSSEFPQLPLSQEPSAQSTGSPLKPADPSSQESQTTNKENAPPGNPGNDSLSQPRIQPFMVETTAALHSSILHTLQTDFSAGPPYTIQRLSELILWPRREYRFLPPYLHALNRVVSVSSNTTIFPLPQASLPPTGTLLNGVSRLAEPALGSDESLGGALLTPIPWLTRNSPSSEADRELQATAQRLQDQQALGTEREPQLQSDSTEMVQGPNGAGRVETVSVVNGGILGGAVPTLGSNSLLTAAGPAPSPSGTPQLATQGLGVQSPPSNIEMALRAEGAVTQGELLRLEQQAGVVPVPSRGLRLSEEEVAMAEGELAEGELDTEMDEEEIPHARGPEEIGVEDTGPQTGHGGVEGLRLASERDSGTKELGDDKIADKEKAGEDEGKEKGA